nr:Uncharacterised protein [Klebsiella pneumoniae]
MKIYDITPIGKPGMTRADKWKQRPEVIRYRAFCDEARLRKIHLPDSGAHVTFVMPMPQSWSQKKSAIRRTSTSVKARLRQYAESPNGRSL